MRLESILLIGDDRRWYHKLRSELRGSCYRLLRARDVRIANWLLERVKIGLILVVPENAPESPLDSNQLNEAWHNLHEDDSGAIAGGTPSFSQRRPLLVIQRETSDPVSRRGSLLEDRQESAERDVVRGTHAEADTLDFAARSGIPVLHLLKDMGGATQGELVRKLNQGVDNILYAPYAQNELIQAIRTAMLNGAAPPKSAASVQSLEIVLQDRMCSLDVSREQLARVLVGTVEQLWLARARVSWAESEVHSLRQALVRQELESQFEQRGLPEAVRGVAHDFANLIEAAGATATALYRQPQSASVYRDAMRDVFEQAQELIECLQDLTSPASCSWRTEPVHLDGLVAQALKSALLPLRQPRIRARVRLGGLEPVWAHRSLVYRALVNLIWNAVQAMPEGGLLSIIGYVRGNRVVLEVGDTGVGIGAKDRKKVLRESFTTKPGHRGMGLTLVRELLEKCGGEITFSSRPKHGSLFSIALPAATGAEVDSPSRVSAMFGSGIKQPVLQLILDEQRLSTKTSASKLGVAEKASRQIGPQVVLQS